MRARRHGWPVLSLALALAVTTSVGCTVDVPATEVLVVVDATDAVKARAVLLQIDVSGADGRDGPFSGNVQSTFGPPPAAIQFPRRIALVPRSSDPRRVFQLRAVARDTSGVVASVLVRSSYVEHRLLELRVVLDATPCAPACAATDTCREGRCVPIFVDPGTLPSFDGGPDSETAPDTGAPDGGVDLGSVDLGMPDLPACTSDAQCTDTNACNGAETCDHGACMPGTPVSCDDGVACTDDSCDPSTGVCSHPPIDALCGDDTGGYCDPVHGCQYPTCSLRTCAPAPLLCEGAMCDVGGVCQRSSSCGAGTFCCAGACMPLGCDDGNDCTIDVCGVSGCMHANAPTGSSCSDGNACTAGDQCVSGECQPVIVYGNGAPCDNGDGCPGDVCVAGVCTSCDDSNACTLEACVGTTCATLGPAPSGTACLTRLECYPGSCSGTMCVSGTTTGACLASDLCCYGRCQPFCG